jgi:hypothetical protein
MASFIKTNYTLFYCTMHDCGCLIKGTHEYTPDGYKMEHSTICDTMDWYNMGEIEYDGVDVSIIKQVRINYERYGGGYEFHMYAYDITDETSESIIMEEDSPLVKWFEEVYNYSKSAGDVIFIE